MSKRSMAVFLKYYLIFFAAFFFNTAYSYSKSYDINLHVALSSPSKDTSHLNDNEFSNFSNDSILEDEFDTNTNSNNLNKELIKDPFEKINRKFFNFSMWVDNNIVSYINDAYMYIIPSPVRISLTNALNNFNEPLVATNHLLQFKFVSFYKTALRFLLNSTLGFFGAVDVASKLNLPSKYNDLGYTLNYYHIGNGIYLFIPLLGPYTITSAIGDFGSGYTYLYSIKTINGIKPYTIFKIQVGARSVGFLNNRKMAHDFLQNSSDPYSFIKSAYIQNRQFVFSQLKNSW